MKDTKGSVAICLITGQPADVAICYTTQQPTTETTCPRGLDECEGEECEEFFIAYSG